MSNITTDAHELASCAEYGPIDLIDGKGGEWTFGQASTIWEERGGFNSLWILMDNNTGNVVSDGYSARMVAEDAEKMGLYLDSNY